LILLPDWFPFNLYKISAWSRTIVVPLAIIWAAKPSCPVPEGTGISELRTGVPQPLRKNRGIRPRLWGLFFRTVDRALKAVEALGWKPLRRKALAASERWIHERLVDSDGLGAIFPPIINTIIAFRCLGYSLDDPRLLAQVRELEKLEIEDGETIRLQPCFSPIWDTAHAVVALADAGVPASDPALVRAARCMIDREVRTAGGGE